MTGPVPDKPEEIDAELAKRLALGLPISDSLIDDERHPGLRESIAYAEDFAEREAALAARVEQKQEKFAAGIEAAMRLAADHLTQ